MNHSIATCVLLIIMSAYYSLQSQSAPYPFIKQYASAFEKAMQQNNAMLLTSYHAQNIRLMPPFQKTMKNANSVATYYQSFSGRFVVSTVRFNSLHTYALDTLLVDQGMYEFTLKLRTANTTHTMTGNYLHLWNIRDQARPLLVTDAWNVDKIPFDNELLRFRGLAVIDVALMAHIPVRDDCSFELAALNRMMEATVAQHDAAAWTLFYADDSFYLANNGGYYAGKEAIRKYLIDHVAEMPVFEKLDIRNDEVIDLKNGYIIEYASHIANWRYDDHSGIGLGKDLRIWKRQPDGRLKIAAHIGSYD